MCRLNINREFTFLFILNMFDTDFLSIPKRIPQADKPKSSTLPSSLLINPHSDPILTDSKDITQQVRLPLLSLSRGNATKKYHSLFHLLCAFHLPTLCSHLDKINTAWWTPFSYPIETQEDFVTVNSIENDSFNRIHFLLVILIRKILIKVVFLLLGYSLLL